MAQTRSRPSVSAPQEDGNECTNELSRRQRGFRGVEQDIRYRCYDRRGKVLSLWRDSTVRRGPFVHAMPRRCSALLRLRAHLRIVSTCLCCPHSAAQASQISAQTLQSSWANCELDESKLAQTEHTGAHSWHKRIDPAILEGSLRASSTQAEHQCRHWRHASIARSMSVLGAVLAMKISPFERHV